MLRELKTIHNYIFPHFYWTKSSNSPFTQYQYSQRGYSTLQVKSKITVHWRIKKERNALSDYIKHRSKTLHSTVKGGKTKQKIVKTSTARATKARYRYVEEMDNGMRDVTSPPEM